MQLVLLHQKRQKKISIWLNRGGGGEELWVNDDVLALNNAERPQERTG